MLSRFSSSTFYFRESSIAESTWSFTPLFACCGTILLTRCKRINPNSHWRFRLTLRLRCRDYLAHDRKMLIALSGTLVSFSQENSRTPQTPASSFVTAIRRYLAKDFISRKSMQSADCELSMQPSLPHASYLAFGFLICLPEYSNVRIPC